MNKKLIGMSMLLATSGAYAQSSIELYGVLDAAVVHVEHSLSADSNFPATVNPVSATKTPVNSSVTALANGGIQDSRWGLRGSEDLGNGMKAFFVLESGFNLPSGGLNNAAGSLAANRNSTSGTVSANSSLDGQLFNRMAIVGLSDSNLGSVSFGRNTTPIFDILTTYDPVQDAQLFSPMGFSGTIGGGGGVSEDTRVDNSIKYTNKMGAFNVGAMYKLGGVAGSTSAQSGYTLNLGYDNGAFGIQGAYEAFTDGMKVSNSTVAGDINVTSYNTSAYFLAAKYKMGDATIRGGAERYTLKQPSDAFTATSLYGYTIGTGTNFASAMQTTDVYFVGGDYNITPAFNVSAGFYDQNAKQSADLAQKDGNIYTYSTLADYHFTKRTDVYAGLMYSTYKGAQYPSTTYNTSNYIFAVGMRTKF